MSNEHMGTEQFEADRPWGKPPAHLRSDAGWELKLGACFLAWGAAFAIGVIMTNHWWEEARQDERAAFAKAVRACQHDLTTGTPVAIESGWVECRALIPRLQNMDRALDPSPRELKRFLLNEMRGELRGKD